MRLGSGCVTALAVAALLVACEQRQAHAVKPGGYQWADQQNSPARYAPAAVTAHFDMSARCLCSEGFRVVDLSEAAFRVVAAPPGYSDTIGKIFLSTPINCLNCAD